MRFCCWHANEVESEACGSCMGDFGKSIAIVTTVQSLAGSLRLDNVQEELDIVPVKYLDFAKKYAPPELKAAGARITVTKRINIRLPSGISSQRNGQSPSLEDRSCS